MELSTTHSHVAYNPNNDNDQGGVIEDVEVMGSDHSEGEIEYFDPVLDQVDNVSNV